MSKELKNSNKIKVGQAVLELLIKNNTLTVLICNLKKINAIFEFLEQFFIRYIIYFFKKLLIILK